MSCAYSVGITRQHSHRFTKVTTTSLIPQSFFYTFSSLDDKSIALVTLQGRGTLTLKLLCVHTTDQRWQSTDVERLLKLPITRVKAKNREAACKYLWFWMFFRAKNMVIGKLRNHNFCFYFNLLLA